MWSARITALVIGPACAVVAASGVALAADRRGAPSEHAHHATSSSLPRTRTFFVDRELACHSIDQVHDIVRGRDWQLTASCRISSPSRNRRPMYAFDLQWAQPTRNRAVVCRTTTERRPSLSPSNVLTLERGQVAAGSPLTGHCSGAYSDGQQITLRYVITRRGPREGVIAVGSVRTG